MYRLLSLLLCFSSIGLFAQPYQFQVRHISSRDGLPNEYVYSLLQSSDQNVWIATNYGVVRFDGFRMHELPKNAINPVADFFEDAEGKIWIVQFEMAWDYVGAQKVDIYDPNIDAFFSFDEYFGDSSPVELSQVNTIINDQDGNIWILTLSDQLIRYDGTFNEMFQLPAALASTVRDYYFKIIIQDNHYWIKENEQDYLWKGDALGNYEKITFPGLISDVQCDRTGALWVKLVNTSLLYKQNEGKGFQRIRLQLEKTRTTHHEKVGIAAKHQQIWYVNQNLLKVFDFSGKLLASLVFAKKGINLKQVNDMYFDKQGRAWLSTDMGIYMIRIEKNKFTKYLDDGQIKDVRDILVDEAGDVFVAQGKIHDLKQKRTIVSPPPGMFISIAKQGDTFWGTAYGKELIKVNMAAGEGIYTRINDSLFGRAMRDPLVYFSKKNGQLWVGGDKGLGIVDTATLAVTPFEQFNEFTSLKNTEIKSFYENEAGIWLSTSDGLYLLDEAQGLLAHYDEIFPYQTILHIHEDKAGIFWLATDRGGLLRWDRSTNEVQQFSRKNGFSHDVIYAVYEDDYGYLWLPSQYGLMRFNKETHNVNVYLPTDGLIHPEFNRFSHAQTADGHLYFGGLGGVVSFHPKDFINQSSDRVPLQIVAVEKLDGRNGQTHDYTKDFTTTKKIVLKPYEKSFRLEFVLLNYERPEENRYAYQIEGIDADWIYTADNFLRVNALPYGKYTLHIKGQSLNQEWSQAELAIPIEVIRPFYLRWWFLLSMVALGIWSIFFFIKRRTDQLRMEKLHLEAEVSRRTAKIEEQANALKALDEQKSRFFMNIAHEIRTPLTLIATPIAHFLQQQENDHKELRFFRSIQKNVNQLLRLVDSILDLSKLDAQQLELQETPTNLATLIRQIFAMYDSYASLHGINYQLSYDAAESLELYLDVPKFEKIIHNLLFNALKFTNTGGGVTLQIEELPHQIKIDVADSGKGIPAEELARIFERYYQANLDSEKLEGGSGIGLSIVKEYTQLMEGDLSVQSIEGIGSTFTLLIPKKLVNRQLATDVLTKETETVVFQEHQNTNGSNARRKKHRILLVEDNVEMQELLRQIIAPIYEVIQAANGIAALEILADQEVDGIITDLMMPQMDGFTLVKHLKANKIWQNLPVIVLTARANDTDKLDALRIGVDDYLYKPFSAEELLVRIDNLIVNRVKRKQAVFAGEEEESLSAGQTLLREIEYGALSLLERRPDFKIMELADSVHISERHFRRKIQALTGMTANEYIREIRLQRAKQLLEQQSMNTVSEISYAVGFTSSSYFSKLYYERFGHKPSAYL